MVIVLRGTETIGGRESEHKSQPDKEEATSPALHVLPPRRRVTQRRLARAVTTPLHRGKGCRRRQAAGDGHRLTACWTALLHGEAPFVGLTRHVAAIRLHPTIPDPTLRQRSLDCRPRPHGMGPRLAWRVPKPRGDPRRVVAHPISPLIPLQDRIKATAAAWRDAGGADGGPIPPAGGRGVAPPCCATWVTTALHAWHDQTTPPCCRKTAAFVQQREPQRTLPQNEQTHSVPSTDWQSRGGSTVG